MSKPLDLLIVGAGPYGLATARAAARAGLDFAIVGEPMGFWRHNMPKGMLLRSGRQWHLDPFGEHSFERFLDARHIPQSGVEPIPVELYLEYTDWFRAASGLVVRQELVNDVTRASEVFHARLAGGASLHAKCVVAAAGAGPFVHVPESLAAMLPAGRSSHTCDRVDFRALAGLHIAIVGGRQSAFEWAALLHEQGAAQVHLIFRHETPRFEPSDWAWVDPMLEQSLANPGWFRRLPEEERESIRRRFWAEGRLKLEPWLVPRLRSDTVHLWPGEEIVSCDESSNRLSLTLRSGRRLDTDLVILATGYRVDVTKIRYLSPSLMGAIATTDGYPRLDEHFQTTVPGLFLPGLMATRDFGPFFGFVRGCPIAARLITEAVTLQVGPVRRTFGHTAQMND